MGGGVGLVSLLELPSWFPARRRGWVMDEPNSTTSLASCVSSGLSGVSSLLLLLDKIGVCVSSSLLLLLGVGCRERVVSERVDIGYLSLPHALID